MKDEPLCPMYGAAHIDPDMLKDLTPRERYVLAYASQFNLRPNQVVPRGDWRSYGRQDARGSGKTFLIATEINRRVYAGEESRIALMAPTIDRVSAVQVAMLTKTAPIWNRPETHGGTLVWPNGTVADFYGVNQPGRPRGSNYSLTWLTEMVDWPDNTGPEAYGNVSTATRTGNAQILWDSTSKGRNATLTLLRSLHKRDPDLHRITTSTTFDNPLFSIAYLKAQVASYTGIRLREELYGEVHEESEGALWRMKDLDKYRILPADVPPELWRVVGIDPATSTHASSDDTGIVSGYTAADGHAYIDTDESGRWTPNQWAGRALDLIPEGGRVTIERNKIGDGALYALRSELTQRDNTRPRNRQRQIVPVKQAAPWPAPIKFIIHVREMVSRDSKGDRAQGPAAATRSGRVHLIDHLPSLEHELTSWIPDQPGQRSPNRLDAFSFAVSELLDLGGHHPEQASRGVQVAAQMNQRLLSAGVRRRPRLGF